MARQREHIVGAAGFIERVLLADAQFKRQPVSDLFPTVPDQCGRAKEDLLTFIPRELGLIRGGNLKRTLGMFRRASRNRSNHLTGSRILNLNNSVGIDLLPTNAHGFTADFLFRHLNTPSEFNIQYY